MKNEPIKILDEVIKPGERKNILMPMPNLYDGTPMFSSIHVINGKKPGPVLCLMGAVHGDELNGVAIIRKFLKSKKINNINGTIIAVPIVNIYGFLYQQRYLMDRRDLNRTFPGSGSGSLASRVAHLFFHEIVVKCTHIIDFHTGAASRINLPQIRSTLNNKQSLDFARAFNAPVILKSDNRAGSLREAATAKKIQCLVYEAGEALRMDALSIKFGIKGIFNILAYLKMLDKKSNPNALSSLICNTSVWVRAKTSGLFNPKVNLGNAIELKEKIGTIANPMNLSEEKIVAPIPGIIIGMNNHPLVHEGSALFNIATPEKLSKKQKEVLELLDNDEVEILVDKI